MNTKAIPAGVFFCLVLAGVLAGCGDETQPEKEPAVATAISLAQDLGAFATLASDFYAVVEVGYLRDDPVNKGISLHPVVGDTLLPGVLTCPVVYMESSLGGVDALAVDYGEGCEAVLDGMLTSGGLRIFATQKPLGGFTIGLEVQDLSRGTATLNGDIALDGARDTVLVATPGLQLTREGKTAGVSGSALLKRLSPLQTGGNQVCLNWSLESGAGVVSHDGAAWRFTVQSPVRRGACCPYPTQGSLRLDADGFVPVLIDFGNGTCDAEAEVTIGSRIQTVTLGE